MWVRCDVCRRYARFRMLEGLADADYRTRRFSYSRCGAEPLVAVVEPNQERGMEDYRLDEAEAPARHPSAVRRLTGRRRSTIDYSGGELPGRRVDPRR